MLDVIYEDNHLMAVNKPAGILVQADITGDESLLDMAKTYLRETYNKPGEAFCGVIHRIDRPVSGLVLLAKTSKGLERMNRLFMERKVVKTYLAVVAERPADDEGELVHWLVKDADKNMVHCHDNQKKDTKEARLSYKLIGKVGKDFLLEVKPHTGRPHQIRVQLAKMGCPIKGDVKYGSSVGMPNGCILLHSHRIAFEHPIKKEPFKLAVGLPKFDDWNKFKNLVS